MAEDTSPDSHDEKHVAQAPEPELADATGRRQSVALNIVENPLKVSRTKLATPAHSMSLRSFEVSALIFFPSIAQLS